MKILIALLIVLSSGQAFAKETPILQCSTAGDALGAVDVILKNGKPFIVVSDLSDNPGELYSVVSGFKDLQKGTSTTIIGQKKGGGSFGGALSDAVLLRVLAGQRKAYFAENGIVFTLHCNLAPTQK